MKKIFLLFVIFLVSVCILEAQNQDTEGYIPPCDSNVGGVLIDGKCFDCGNSADGICPNVVLAAVYPGLGYETHCGSGTRPTDPDCVAPTVPAVVESISKQNCDDDIDNDDDGHQDYDWTDKNSDGLVNLNEKGDNECFVGIESIGIAQSTYCPGDTITVACRSYVGDLNSIEAFVSNACSYQKWDENEPIVIFSCTTPGTASGTLTATCSVNTDKSYPLQNHEQESGTIARKADCASEYDNPTDCTNAGYTWVYSQGSGDPDTCFNNKYYSSADPAGICLAENPENNPDTYYTCVKDKCTAECDNDVGGCTPQFGTGDFADYCYYDRTCDNTCQCTTGTSAYCPSAGTVDGSTCYYGSSSTCDDATGCSLSTCTLQQGQSCYATSGCLTEPKELLYIIIDPLEVVINVDNSQSYTITAHYSDDTTADVTASSTLTSDNTAIATTSAQTATAIAQGEAKITASYTENDITVTTQSILTITPVIEEVECSDDDITSEFPDGKNYYLQGTTHGRAGWSEDIITKTDSCYDCNNVTNSFDSCEAGSTCCVNEWYCSGNKVYSGGEECLYGCENGACKSITDGAKSPLTDCETACTDPDGCTCPTGCVETEVADTQTCGIPPVSGECTTIDSVTWKDESGENLTEINEGEKAYAEISATDCIGATITYQIMEKDILVTDWAQPDDVIEEKTITIQYAEGAVLEWVATRQQPLDGFNPNNAYYVKIEELKSELLNVLEVPTDCGNSLIEGTEECDRGANCLENCSCESGYRPTTPKSKDCEEIPADDGDKPSTSIDIQEKPDNNQEITLTCDDGTGSGCEETKYCIETTTNPCTDESTYTTYTVTINYQCTDVCIIHYFSTDKAGNTEDDKAATFGPNAGCTILSTPIWTNLGGEPLDLATPVASGTPVKLKMTGTLKCNGNTAIFTVYEDNPEGPDSVGIEPAPIATIEENMAISTWTTQYKRIGLREGEVFDTYTDPEFIFKVDVKDSTNEIVASATSGQLNVIECTPGCYYTENRWCNAETHWDATGKIGFCTNCDTDFDCISITLTPESYTADVNTDVPYAVKLAYYDGAEVSDTIYTCIYTSSNTDVATISATGTATTKTTESSTTITATCTIVDPTATQDSVTLTDTAILTVSKEPISCTTATEEEKCGYLTQESCTYTTCIESTNTPKGTRIQGYCGSDNFCTTKSVDCMADSPCTTCCDQGECKTEKGNQVCIDGEWETFDPGECGKKECNEEGECAITVDHTQCDPNDPDPNRKYDFICESIDGGFKCADLKERDTGCCYCYTTCLEKVKSTKAEEYCITAKNYQQILLPDCI